MKQERKFPLAEVHTKMGALREVHLNQAFLDVLGVKPGDFLVFSVSKEGVVTVSGEKKSTSDGQTPMPVTTSPSVPRPDQVTQTALLTADEPPERSLKHDRRRK